jgi:hypothetical protein
MIEDIKKVAMYLAKDRRAADLANKIEANLIKRHADRLEWGQLGPEEKQEKRKAVLKSVKKYMEEDGIATFTYENAVVSFYQVGLGLLKVLNDESKKEILLLRLSVLINIDMDSIDMDSTLHNKKITPLMVYNNLREELIAKSCYPKEMDQLIKSVEVLNPAMKIPNT